MLVIDAEPIVLNLDIGNIMATLEVSAVVDSSEQVIKDFWVGDVGELILWLLWNCSYLAPFVIKFLVC